MLKTLIASLDRRDDADRATQALRQAGFLDADINMVFNNVQRDDSDTSTTVSTAETGPVTKGAVAGGVLGGAAGLAASLAGLAIPGVGPILAAGPIVAALAGAGAGAVTGGLIGALTGLGMPEYEAKRFEGRIRSGAILMSVHCDSSEWEKRAKDILEKSGATDISSAAEAS